MMKLPQKAFPLVLILFSFVIGDKIAVTTKVKGTVELMAVGNKEYLNLKPGTVLSDGDKIRTGKSGFTAVIFIDDNGPGIPDHEKENVLKPFYRMDESRSQNKSGVGLGLSISYDIIRSHGGDMLLETSPQKGLRVKISLPS